MAESLRVGLTWDFQGSGLLDGPLAQVLGGVPGLVYETMAPGGGAVAPEQLAGYDAVIALLVPFDAESLAGAGRLAAIARWGVGYDMIDVAACTAHDVALCITPEAVRRPVAEGVVTLMLALAKRLLIQDRLTRSGRWGEKTRYIGRGLEGRVLGLVGLGNIGRELVRLLQPFGLARILGYDPYLPEGQAAALGAQRVDLDTLLREADFVSLNCPLTAETRGLIGARELGLMKPAAYLINTARGPIVDQAALARALETGQIAGAALDVFAQEPIAPDDPLLRLENTILTPHAIAWTEELARDNGLEACRNVLAVLQGQVPPQVVNREVLGRPGFQAKLARLHRRWERLHRRVSGGGADGSAASV